MVLGSVGRGVLTRLETLHQAGLLTVILRSQIPNNSQWCRDWYADKLPGGKETNPLGPLSGSFHVMRGGCLFVVPADCRCAMRNYGGAGAPHDIVGFRIALCPAP